MTKITKFTLSLLVFTLINACGSSDGERAPGAAGGAAAPNFSFNPTVSSSSAQGAASSTTTVTEDTTTETESTEESENDTNTESADMTETNTSTTPGPLVAGPAPSSGGSGSDSSGSASSSRISNFLWKPEAERDGKLVVLVNPRNVVVVVNGATMTEQLRDSGPSNGRGTTARGSFSGCEYGSNIIVEFFTPSGNRIFVANGDSAVVVENGCDRKEFSL